MTTAAATDVRYYTVPCPGCGTAHLIEEGGPSAVRGKCDGCGKLLTTVRTRTLFMTMVAEPALRSQDDGLRVASEPVIPVQG